MVTNAPMLMIVESTAKPGRNSLRTIDGGDPRQVLKDFKPGDIVHVVEEKDFMHLITRDDSKDKVVRFGKWFSGYMLDHFISPIAARNVIGMEGSKMAQDAMDVARKTYPNASMYVLRVEAYAVNEEEENNAEGGN